MALIAVNATGGSAIWHLVQRKKPVFELQQKRRPEKPPNENVVVEAVLRDQVAALFQTT